ncbi:MAG: hypothetical protein R3Y23_01485 [Bacillota bacterium]
MRNKKIIILVLITCILSLSLTGSVAWVESFQEETEFELNTNEVTYISISLTEDVIATLAPPTAVYGALANSLDLSDPANWVEGSYDESTRLVVEYNVVFYGEIGSSLVIDSLTMLDDNNADFAEYFAIEFSRDGATYSTYTYESYLNLGELNVNEANPLYIRISFAIADDGLDPAVKNKTLQLTIAVSIAEPVAETETEVGGDS